MHHHHPFHQTLARLGGGRVTLVCGGGAFADVVRQAQGHWGFVDLSAHNMAVLAMLQAAWASDRPRHGWPQGVDPLEGWIVSA